MQNHQAHKPQYHKNMNITVKEAGKTYPDGTVALKDISFTIKPGEGVVILGSNGCGKSTLLKMMLGLESATKGSILFDDKDITKSRGRTLRRIRLKVGSVFQHFNLVGNVSVFQNVLFGIMGHKGLLGSLNLTASSETRDQACHCLNRVGLVHLMNRRTDTLSGGQQQRLAIARMLMQNPVVVFADEPVASLDPKAGRQVMELLWDVVEERKMTVVCVLHQLDLALEYAERIIGIKQGLVAFDSSPSKLEKQILETLYEGEEPEDSEEYS